MILMIATILIISNTSIHSHILHKYPYPYHQSHFIACHHFIAGWMRICANHILAPKKMTEFHRCHHRSHPTIRPGRHPTANVWVPTLLVLRSSNVETSKPQTREISETLTKHPKHVKHFAHRLSPKLFLLVVRDSLRWFEGDLHCWIALNCYTHLRRNGTSQNLKKKQLKKIKDNRVIMCHRVAWQPKGSQPRCFFREKTKGCNPCKKNNYSKSTLDELVILNHPCTEFRISEDHDDHDFPCDSGKWWIMMIETKWTKAGGKGGRKIFFCNGSNVIWSTASVLGPKYIFSGVSVLSLCWWWWWWGWR